MFTPEQQLEIKRLINDAVAVRNPLSKVYDRLPGGSNGDEGEIRLSFSGNQFYISAYINKQWRTQEFDMASIDMKPWYLQVAEGLVPGYSLVHKFGAGTLTTTMAPITVSGIYSTPTTAQALEFVSADANDTAAGTGAQQITIEGLNSSWNRISQTLETNGTTAVALTTNLTRLDRWYVSRSGTYATATSGSHVGALTIRASGAGAIWSTVPIAVFPAGQSQVGVYSIPAGYTGRLLTKNIFVDSTKSADVYFFKRDYTSDVTTPFTGAMRLVEREVGIVGGYSLQTAAPKASFIGPCDIGFMGKISVGTAECSVEFELILKKT